LPRGLSSNIREVASIDLRWRSGLGDLGCGAVAIRPAICSRGAKSLSLGGDGLLELRVCDLEAAFCSQLDADTLEPLVSPNREGPPFLGAQLEGS
jgi:hypothetical protein